MFSSRLLRVEAKKEEKKAKKKAADSRNGRDGVCMRFQLLVL